MRNRAALVILVLGVGVLLALQPWSAHAARRMLGFGLRGTCTGCHGLPPVSSCDETAAFAASPSLARSENYPGGGGAHWVHVQFLRDKLGLGAEPDKYDERLCTPCHGLNPGLALTWHLESGTPPGWTWPTASGLWQEDVDIIDATGNFGGLAQYDGGGTLRDVLTTVSAKGGEPQACVNLNCHGPGATTKSLDVTAGDPYAVALADPGALWWDQTCFDDGTPPPTAAQQAAGRDNACAGCHASRGAGASQPATRIQVGTYDSDLPDALPQGATAHYFGTVSGYSRGGHGDPEIQNEDPGVDSATSPPAPAGQEVTPLPCTACHDDDPANHFPAAGDIHRLGGATIESAAHATTEVCNSCHPPADYPGEHHPSYRGPVGDPPVVSDIIPAFGQEVYTAPTTWSEGAPPVGHYEQDGYRATNRSGNPDYFVDWWGGTPGNGNQDPPPTPAPLAVLPLERFVLDTGTSDITMCTTCHNPHGTDLYVFDNDQDCDPVTPGIQPCTEISDNNMLRLRDSDTTLCTACH